MFEPQSPIIWIVGRSVFHRNSLDKVYKTRTDVQAPSDIEVKNPALRGVSLVPKLKTSAVNLAGIETRFPGSLMPRHANVVYLRRVCVEETESGT
jgi:hypothetical protein